MKDLGERLKNLRTERDLTMDMVCYAMEKNYNIEITRGHLSKWENGKNDPSLRLAAYLAQFYGVSLDYLIGLTDNKAPADVLARGKKNG